MALCALLVRPDKPSDTDLINATISQIQEGHIVYEIHELSHSSCSQSGSATIKFTDPEHVLSPGDEVTLKASYSSTESAGHLWDADLKLTFTQSGIPNDFKPAHEDALVDAIHEAILNKELGSIGCKI